MEQLPFVIPKQFAVIGVLFGGLILLILLLMLFKYGWLYIQALASGAPVSLIQLVGMTLRRVRARVVVESRIMAKKAGIEIDTQLLEAHYLAGGNVINVVCSLIAANKANIDLTFKQACA
ncbi:MAG: flotillin-like FloA family protein, partial [Candidatus Brocadiales bacterium]